MPRFPAVATCLSAMSLLLFAIAIADERNTTLDEPSDVANQLRETTIQALRPLGPLIGEWKGVGQPKRGSNVGAWTETAVAAWRFEPQSAALLVTFKPGQRFRLASFSVLEDHKTPSLTLTPVAGDHIKLTLIPSDVKEKAKSESWIFESSVDSLPQIRCTVRIISDIRVTMLFEEKTAEKSSYRRLSEIGLTRAGARLASGNAGERLCVVTGGLGSIKVTHEGQTFYVCCEGCKQAFDADPAGTIQSHRDRLKNAGKGK
jgi:hypothetical protein